MNKQIIMELKNETSIMKSVVVLLAAGCLCAGCSTKEHLDARGVIRLGVENATRASINNVSDLATHAGDKVGIIGMETDSQTPAAGVWNGALIMDNVQTSGIDADGTIHWAGTYYYPMEADHFVKFCAYHPYAASGTSGDSFVAMPTAGQAPVLHFVLDGQEDVMYAGPVVGSSKVAPDKLTFKHVLTQLTFELEDPDGEFTGATLEGITFQDVNTRSSMDIETGALGAWSEPKSVDMPGIASVPFAAKDAKQPIDGEIMLQPGLPEFLITVRTSVGTFTDVKITPTQNSDGSAAATFGAEQSYRISLRFAKKTLISLGATVQPWQFGGTGSGVIE